MSKCDYCGTGILFGGVRDGSLSYCNDRCKQLGLASAVSFAVADDPEIQREVMSVYQGACPKCGGSGPVDVHVSHRVWSALLITSWASRPQLCCRSCGVKQKIGDIAFSAALGWWGIPWGPVMTPVQIGRNVVALARTSEPSCPSEQLQKLVKIRLVSKACEVEVKPSNS